MVEDYAYPGAEAIQTSSGITLISGDGQIILADCATPPEGDLGLLRVRTSRIDDIGKDGLTCFKVLTAPGLLTLKVPAVYEIRGDGRVDGAGHKVKAELTTDQGQHTTVEVDPSGPTQVGVGTNPTSRPTTLLQLTAVP
ncbi:hypothetical protein [Amycolatopsis panacis]|uniref:Uncharacterized protein n=1 Tax=Amycolatopsis panacis TaxID=2340917 RepID=A0A419IAC3_9PSEU|nr:hypothetical protein [Amycolatopsis panacis]RJQ89987.1 hypothetical protein D5S19_03230 [Amycolatopsis panacis]